MCAEVFRVMALHKCSERPKPAIVRDAAKVSSQPNRVIGLLACSTRQFIQDTQKPDIRYRMFE